MGTRDDSAAFEALAVPHLDALFNFARWLCQDTAEAEDLVQETFVKALKGFSSFREGTNFRAWIFRILRNSFLTSRAGLRRHGTVPLENDEGEEVAITVENPESILLASTNQLELQRAIELLPLPYQEVLLLADVEEMSYQEISEALGIPIGTVMSRLARARQRIRAHFREGAYHHAL